MNRRLKMKKLVKPTVNSGDKLIQGDVILRRIDKLPEGMVKVDMKSKILQTSEVTGHHHQFALDAAVDLFVPETKTKELKKSKRDITELDMIKFVTDNENKYIVVNKDSILFHGKEMEYEAFAKGTGDHDAQIIPAGIYEIDIVRTFDYNKMEMRRVID